MWMKRLADGKRGEFLRVNRQEREREMNEF